MTTFVYVDDEACVDSDSILAVECSDRDDAWITTIHVTKGGCDVIAILSKWPVDKVIKEVMRAPATV